MPTSVGSLPITQSSKLTLRARPLGQGSSPVQSSLGCQPSNIALLRMGAVGDRGSQGLHRRSVSSVQWMGGGSLCMEMVDPMHIVRAYRGVQVAGASLLGA